MYKLDYNLVKILSGDMKSYTDYRRRIDLILKKTKPNPSQTRLFRDAFLSTVNSIAKNKKGLATNLLFFHRDHRKASVNKRALYLNNITSKIEMMKSASQLEGKTEKKLKFSLYKKIEKDFFVYNNRRFLDVKNFSNLSNKKRVLEYNFKTERIELVDNIFYKKKHLVNGAGGPVGSIGKNEYLLLDNTKNDHKRLMRIKKILMRHHDYLLVRMVTLYDKCNLFRERYNRALAKLNPNSESEKINSFFARRQYLIQDICSVNFYQEDSVTLVMQHIYDAKSRNEISQFHYEEMMKILQR